MAVNSVIINGGWTSQPYKGYDKWRRINITNRDLEILRTEFPEVDKVSARVQDQDNTTSPTDATF